MERESFENEEIAALMNRHYVAIKVDREERPDVARLSLNLQIRPDLPKDPMRNAPNGTIKQQPAGDPRLPSITLGLTWRFVCI